MVVRRHVTSSDLDDRVRPRRSLAALSPSAGPARGTRPSPGRRFDERILAGAPDSSIDMMMLEHPRESFRQIFTALATAKAQPFSTLAARTGPGWWRREPWALAGVAAMRSRRTTPNHSQMVRLRGMLASSPPNSSRRSPDLPVHPSGYRGDGAAGREMGRGRAAILEGAGGRRPRSRPCGASE